MHKIRCSVSIVLLSYMQKNLLLKFVSPYLLLFVASFRWVFPFIGHMGICTSSGVIRDFAGSYYVSVGVDLV